MLFYKIYSISFSRTSHILNVLTCDIHLSQTAVTILLHAKYNSTFLKRLVKYFLAPFNAKCKKNPRL